MDQAIVDLKREMVRAARRAYAIGLQTGNGGNLSARVPGRDLVLIKPSGASFGECTEENLVGVTLAGEIVFGEAKPSRELLTHIAVYRARSDVNGVVHTHSPWAIACADMLDELPLHTYHAGLKLGPVPVLAVDGHADEAVADAAGAMLAKRPQLRAFIQRRHGIFALADSVRAAEHVAELVEETAQIAWLLSGRSPGPGRSAALSAALRPSGAEREQ